MKNIVRVSLIVLISFCLPYFVMGQIHEVRKGNIVRISAPGISDNVITGTVVSLGVDFLRVSQANNGYLLIPFDAIDQLHLRRIKRRTGQGAVNGALIGGLISGITLAALNRPCNPDDWCMFRFSTVEALGIGFGVGLVTGAIIGAIVGRSTKKVQWKRVDFPLYGQAQASIRLAKDMPGLTFRLSM